MYGDKRIFINERPESDDGLHRSLPRNDKEYWDMLVQDKKDLYIACGEVYAESESDLAYAGHKFEVVRDCDGVKEHRIIGLVHLGSVPIGYETILVDNCDFRCMIGSTI